MKARTRTTLKISRTFLPRIPITIHPEVSLVDLTLVLVSSVKLTSTLTIIINYDAFFSTILLRFVCNWIQFCNISTGNVCSHFHYQFKQCLLNFTVQRHMNICLRVFSENTSSKTKNT